jgi:hypothetical protein
MKNYFLIPPTVLLVALLCCTSFKCSKDSPLNCDKVICSDVFAMIGIYISDLSMTPEKLEVYTIRNSTGEKITLTQNETNIGVYFILDDSYRSKIAGTTETFTFVGTKAGTQIFQQTYQIKADCCHVSKVSGKDSLTIPH